ncbi:23S rRNA (uracil(747)-C(5))-methyltransferase RlmC [Mannheimia haemolytica]
MVVSGSVERPILGILKDQHDPQSGVDLTDCLLYPASFYSLFPILKDFIGRAGLVPYNIKKKKGELKYILITESQYNQSLMLRFVVRSESKRALVERELPHLLEKLPPNSVVSLNIQPQHAAVLEGETEIFLTERKVIEENFNSVPLFIRPQGFFQTNPTVASQFYLTAQQ